MEIGILQVMQSWGYEGITDGEVYDQELEIAVKADALGFDHIWTVEHHFENYSFCPDNFVYLAFLASKTRNIRLATGACIVPWNTQPLRVAEKAALLDQLCGGRLILGLGRGLSRREFNQFGIDMDESRERFDEAAPMILEALETGVMAEHDGTFFKQPRAVIRPKPTRTFKDRLTQVAMSPDSAEEAAKLGAQMMAFNYKPPAQQKEEYENYKSLFRQYQGSEPRPMLFTDMTIVDTDIDRARTNAEKYIAGYLVSVMDHYEMMGEHYKHAKGYESYGAAVDMMREAGMEEMCKAYVEQQVWGTPDMVLRKFEERRALMGETGELLAFRFAGMPMECTLRSMDLFAREVMPVLRGRDAEGSSVAA
jgi:alkanesulfonate monooxygenase SsuD/methylene tetrahydromethanopterin reductase-like flavin-dependent oxidoreductase (luciferase family)